MRGGAGIGSRFLIVVDKEAESSTTNAAKRLAGSFAGVAELRLAGRPGVTLIRPDGYIAYSAPNGPSVAALGSVRSLLERQVS